MVTAFRARPHKRRISESMFSGNDRRKGRGIFLFLFLCGSPIQESIPAMALPRGAIVLSAALTLAVVVTMLVVDGGVRRDNVLEMREELALKPLTYGGTEGKSTADAAAGAVAKANEAVGKAGDSSKSTKEPGKEAGFLADTTDDSAPDSKRAVTRGARTSTPIGPGVLTAALSTAYRRAKVRTVAGMAQPHSAAKTNVLEMTDGTEGSVPSGSRDTVPTPFDSPREMKEVEKVQAAVKAEADAEIDQAIAASKKKAAGAYSATRDRFMQQEAANPVLGPYVYSASDEIYTSDVYPAGNRSEASAMAPVQTLTELPERAFTVAVPAGVASGQTFLARVLGGAELRVTVPAHVRSGQELAIEVPRQARAMRPWARNAQKQRSLAREVSAERAGDTARGEQQRVRAKPPATSLMATEKSLATRLEDRFLKEKQKIAREDSARDEAALVIAEENAGGDHMSSSRSPAHELPKPAAHHGDDSAPVKAELHRSSTRKAVHAPLLPASTSAAGGDASAERGGRQRQKTGADVTLANRNAGKRAVVAESEVPPDRAAAKPVAAAKPNAMGPADTKKKSQNQDNEDSGPDADRTTMQASALAKAVNMWAAAHKKSEKEAKAKALRDSLAKAIQRQRRQAAAAVQDAADKAQQEEAASSPAAVAARQASAYWGGAGSSQAQIHESYYGVAVPLGLSAGQQFLAEIPGGPQMLVTVPAGVGAGGEVAVQVPAVSGDPVAARGQSLAQLPLHSMPENTRRAGLKTAALESKTSQQHSDLAPRLASPKLTQEARGQGHL